jgi:hypothetical protein
VSPVKYELGFYIAEDGILHNHRRETLKSYLKGSHLSDWTCISPNFNGHNVGKYVPAATNTLVKTDEFLDQ